MSIQFIIRIAFIVLAVATNIDNAWGEKRVAEEKSLEAVKLLSVKVEYSNASMGPHEGLRNSYALEASKELNELVERCRYRDELSLKEYAHDVFNGEGLKVKEANKKPREPQPKGGTQTGVKFNYNVGSFTVQDHEVSEIRGVISHVREKGSHSSYDPNGMEKLERKIDFKIPDVPDEKPEK